MIASILIMCAIVMAIYLVHVVTRKVRKGEQPNLGWFDYKDDRLVNQPEAGRRSSA